jgi:glycosyltransferase involved in cell wall biosynthesis
MKNERLDVVIPIFNEEDAIHALVSRIRNSLDKVNGIEWRLILVENGSTDSSHDRIQCEMETEPRITEVRLLRNFGMEGGLLAGLSIAGGDACVMMQGDLEDPPELIPKMLDEWRKGNDVVYGEVTSRNSVALWRRIMTASFYRIAKFLTNGVIRPNASDYRLISRPVRDFLVSTPDQALFLRSLVMWPSTRTKGIPFERGKRHSGVTKFRPGKAIFFSLVGVFSQSLKPLRFITLLGITAFIGSLIGLAILMIRALFWSVPFAGFGTIVGFQVLFFGILMLALGVVSEYVAMIFQEVRPRPHYLIDSITTRSDQLGLDN